MTKTLRSYAVFLLILLVGCSANENVASHENHNDEYNQIRKLAWDFIQEKGWDKHAEKEWKSADVQVVVVDKHYELFDEAYRDKEVLEVSFVDRADTVVGTPEILVDSETGEVVGYLPGE